MKHNFVIDTHSPDSFLEGEAWGDVVSRDEDFAFTPITAGTSLNLQRPFTSRYDRMDGRYLPVYQNEIDLAYQRAEARVVREVLPTSVGAMGNLANYTLGKGFTFTVGRDETAAETQEQLQPLIDAAQRIVNKFLDEIKFIGRMDREAHNVVREDGETFLHLRLTGGGVTLQRLWPDQVTQPANARQLEDWLGCGEEYPSNWLFGVHTKEGLPEIPLGYHVLYNESGSDWDYVPSDRMVHIKANVPSTAKRGVSDFYPVTSLFRQDSKLGRNLGVTAAIQAALAWIRQHAPGVTPSGAQTLAGANKSADFKIASQFGPQTRSATGYPAGSILDIANGMQYLAGPTGMAQANPNLLMIKDMLLRMIGVRWQMPEYMISANAGNADYSSTKEAGHPFVKARETDQVFFGQSFLELIWKALRLLYDAGRFAQFGLSWERLEAMLTITVSYPSVATKDPQALATTQQILVQTKAMSIRTMAEQQGLDYDHERENMEKDGDAAADPNAPQPGDGTEQGGGERLDINSRTIGKQESWTKRYVDQYKAGQIPLEVCRAKLVSLGVPAAEIALYLDDDATNDPVMEAIEGDVVTGKKKSKDVPTLPSREELAAQVALRANQLVERMADAVLDKDIKEAKRLGKELDALYEHAQQAAATLGMLGMFDPRLGGKPPRKQKQEVAVIEPNEKADE